MEAEISKQINEDLARSKSTRLWKSWITRLTEYLQGMKTRQRQRASSGGSAIVSEDFSAQVQSDLCSDQHSIPHGSFRMFLKKPSSRL